MKSKLLVCFFLCLAALVRTAELAPASAQYSVEGRRIAPASAQYSLEGVQVLPGPSDQEEEKPLRILPGTVWARVELRDGRVLERARATQEEAATVTFRHAGGIAKIDKRLLPPELAELFPFDHRAAKKEKSEQAAAKAAAIKEKRAADEAAAEREARGAAAGTYTPQSRRSATTPSSPPAASGEDEIERVAKARAREYFENEKRTGSGATMVFGVTLRTEEPVSVSGWPGRWRIDGVASYKVYDSVGWGSFSTRSGRRFEVIVDAPAGKRPKVVDFSER